MPSSYFSLHPNEGPSTGFDVRERSLRSAELNQTASLYGLRNQENRVSREHKLPAGERLPQAPRIRFL